MSASLTPTQMADQMSMPMAVHEISVTGATNIRRGFLDPIFGPILSDSPSAPSTFGEVLAKLQTASTKLSGLRACPLPTDHWVIPTDERRNTARASEHISFSVKPGRPLYEPVRCQRLHSPPRATSLQAPNGN